MAKMVGKPEESVSEVPLLIFSEEEVQKVADFVNFMYKNAEFKMGMQVANQVSRMFNDMHGHVSKIEGYILEHKRSFTKAKS